MSVDKVDWERLSDLKAAWQQACDTGPSSEATAAYQRYSREVTIAFPAIKAEREALARKVRALEEALTPSDDTKVAYMSEVRCDSYAAGLPDHFVPWVSIKNTMSQIRIFAALKEQSHDG